MDGDDTQSAFLDIATNLLAVVLIVTLFSLLAVPHQSSGAAHPLARASTQPRFVEPRRDLFPPFSSFYFVFEDRVMRWDQDAVVDALLADPARRQGTTAQGRYDWLPEPLALRDLDAFRLRFFPDLAAARAREPRWSPDRSAALLVALRRAWDATRTAPVFIVYPDGMETFVPLYEQLQAAGLRFRWFARRPDEPLFLGRTPEQFTDYAIYW